MDVPAKRAYVMGLLIACPYKSSLSTCALYDIRSKPVKERMAWARQLTDEQIQDVIDIHKECFIRREYEADIASPP